MSKRGHKPELGATLLQDFVRSWPCICMSEDMSISFKVVSDAAVFCGSFRRTWITFTCVSFRCPGQQEAWNRVAISVVWMGGQVSSQSLVGVVHLSAFSVVEGKCLWVFQLCGRQLSSDPQERSRLVIWRQCL